MPRTPSILLHSLVVGGIVGRPAGPYWDGGSTIDHRFRNQHGAGDSAVSGAGGRGSAPSSMRGGAGT